MGISALLVSGKVFSIIGRLARLNKAVPHRRDIDYRCLGLVYQTISLCGLDLYRFSSCILGARTVASVPVVLFLLFPDAGLGRMRLREQSFHFHDFDSFRLKLVFKILDPVP